MNAEELINELKSSPQAPKRELELSERGMPIQTLKYLTPKEIKTLQEQI